MNALAQELCRAARDATTGAVEWRDEKRRRLFFFRQGVLVLIQSNLKSESPERVAERAPDADAGTLADMVAATRIREALGETRGAVTLHVGVPAPGFEALDLMTLLFDAADRLPGLPPRSWPRVVPSAATLVTRVPAGAEVVRYLLELDGSRPLEDVLDFGPADPDTLARALALAHALGAVTSGEAVDAVVKPAAAAAPAPPAADPPPADAPVASPASPAPVAPPSAPLWRPSAAATPAVTPPAQAAPFSIDDIADGIRDALDQPTGEAPLPSAPPTPGVTAPPGSATPPGPTAPSAASPPAPGDTAWATKAATPPRPPPASPFGGASATVTLGAGGPEVAAGVNPEDIDALERFGPLLTRVRGATDHFAVLGTTWQDPVETHRRAYFALAQRLHPDRYATDPDAIRDVATELFDRIRTAWEVLGDDTRRAAYIARVIRGEKSEEEIAMEKVRRILEAEADFKRGMTELNGGRIAAAHEHFAKAAQGAPEEVEFGAYAAYTTFRLAHGKDDRAATDAARRVHAALQANEKLDGVWVLHGIVQKALGNEGAARTAFVTALKHKPSNPDALREMKRLEREREATQEPAASFLSKLFKKK